MRIEVDRSGTLEALSEVLSRMQKDPEVKGVLLLSCDANGFNPPELDPLLMRDLPIFGGIFPEIIHGREKLEKGSIALGLPTAPRIHLLRGLSDMEADYDELLDEAIPDLGTARTAVVLVDGFAKRIAALVDSLFNVFGLEINYVGGGAGSLSMVQKPCLFTPQGFVEDAALLALLDLQSGVGVSHGWESVAGPFTVTEVDRNVIHTLNWRPAFEVYREVVEDHAAASLSEENFFDLAKHYPFGINKIDTERIIRDPFSVGEGGSLICVGEVPRDSLVDIMNGESQNLVRAAATALELARDDYEGGPGPRQRIFMDCISRTLCLEEGFSKELDAVYEEGKPLVGALTIGEIANSGRDYLEFYNKTAVVAVLEG